MELQAITIVTSYLSKVTFLSEKRQKLLFEEIQRFGLALAPATQENGGLSGAF
jgi:hypothetical protein